MHHILRHPLLPWAELRISTDSRHCYRLHTHAEYSLGLVDAGHANFQHGATCEPLQAGDVVMIEPQVWHACNPPWQAPWSYRMLYLDADWLHTRMQQPGCTFAQRAWHDAGMRQALQTLCHHLQHGQATAFAHGLQTLLNQSQVLRSTPHTLAWPAGASSIHAQGIRHAMALLHDDLPITPSVAALARAADLSVSHFIRVFKAHTGVTPASYRLNARVQGARQLLAQGAALSDAALAMGFADQAHLQRSFKAHHAMTPGQYAPTATPVSGSALSVTKANPRKA